MAATRADLMALLEQLGLKTQTFDHQAVFTVEESRDIKASIAGGHSKNLFLKDKKSRLFMVSALGDAVIDLKKIHDIIGANGRVSFGSGELLEEVWGVKPGSVTPFGAINDREGRVTVVLDSAMLEHEILNFHPLENTATTSISRNDLITFLKATGHEPLITRVSS